MRSSHEPGIQRYIWRPRTATEWRKREENQAPSQDRRNYPGRLKGDQLSVIAIVTSTDVKKRFLPLFRHANFFVRLLRGTGTIRCDSFEQLDFHGSPRIPPRLSPPALRQHDRNLSFPLDIDGNIFRHFSVTLVTPPDFESRFFFRNRIRGFIAAFFFEKSRGMCTLRFDLQAFNV